MKCRVDVVGILGTFKLQHYTDLKKVFEVNIFRKCHLTLMIGRTTHFYC